MAKTHERFSFYQDEPIAISHRANIETDPNLRGGINQKDNTLSGIQAVANLGGKDTEIDIVVTADGVPVLYHGHALKIQQMALRSKLATQKQISQMDYRQILRLNLGDEPTPTLAEAFSSFPEMRFWLDIKRDDGLPEISKVLKQQNAESRVCVFALKDLRLRRFREILAAQDREVTMALASARGMVKVRKLLLAERENDAKKYINRIGASSVIFDPRLANESLIDKSHEIGIRFFSYFWLPQRITPKKADKQLGNGVDGIIANDVGIVMDAIAKL